MLAMPKSPLTYSAWFARPHFTNPFTIGDSVSPRAVSP
jgi:hypothetical protein